MRLKVSVSFIKNKYNNEKKTIEEINQELFDYVRKQLEK